MTAHAHTLTLSCLFYVHRVYDKDESELMRHWDDTYQFIEEARLGALGHTQR